MPNPNCEHLEASMAILNRTLFSATLMLVALFACSLAFAADDAKKDDAKKDAPKTELKVIKPDEAKDHDGEVVIVEFKVIAAREIDSGVCFLNSGAQSDPKRFTAFLSGKAMKKYREDPKTEKPADLYKGKKIQVSGAIKKYKDAFEIEVNDPSQIKIVEEKKDEKADEKKS
jgi:hypothetical protein